MRSRITPSLAPPKTSTSSSTQAGKRGPVYAALARFGAPLCGRDSQGFPYPESIFHVGLPPSRINILQDIEGIDFEPRETPVSRDNRREIPVRYISVEDLIRNKLAIGRLRDLADVRSCRSQAANTKLPNPDEPD